MSEPINFVITKQTVEVYAVVAEDAAKAKQIYNEGQGELLQSNESVNVRVQQPAPQVPSQAPQQQRTLGPINIPVPAKPASG